MLLLQGPRGGGEDRGRYKQKCTKMWFHLPDFPRLPPLPGILPPLLILAAAPMYCTKSACTRRECRITPWLRYTRFIIPRGRRGRRWGTDRDICIYDITHTHTRELGVVDRCGYICVSMRVHRYIRRSVITFVFCSVR